MERTVHHPVTGSFTVVPVPGLYTDGTKKHLLCELIGIESSGFLQYSRDQANVRIHVPECLAGNTGYLPSQHLAEELIPGAVNIRVWYVSPAEKIRSVDAELADGALSGPSTGSGGTM